jgi:hypothetical protein
VTAAIPEHLQWALAAAAGIVTAAMVAGAVADAGPVDRALPLLAAAIFVCGWVFRDRCRWVAMLVPALIVTAIAASDERTRLLLYGVIWSAAIVAAVAASVREHSIARNDALVLVGLIAIPFRTIGFAPAMLPGTVLVLAGSALLLAMASRKRAIGLAAFIAAAATAVATPVVPVRVSLFPLLLSVLISPMPFGFRAGGAVLVGLAAGRWSWPLIAVVLLAEFLKRERRDHEAAAVLPFYAKPLSLAAALRPALFLPSAVPSLVPLALILVAAFVRPPVAMLYALAAIVLGARDQRVSAWPAVAFSAVVLSMVGWSGAIVTSFPLPISFRAVVSVAAIGALAALSISRPLRIAGAFAIAAGALWLPLTTAVAWADRGAELAPGESQIIDLSRRGRRVEIVASAANAVALRRNAVLGRIEVIDVRGRAWRRELRVGDASDWAALTPGEYWRSHNGVPWSFSEPIDGAGASAILNGAGRISMLLADDASVVHVTADASLPENVRLLIDRVGVRVER